ncbi:MULTISPECIES: GH1 family beta-glucosidase [Thermomonospora]|uniref:Beta-glucosidase n=1 Tax=Thermomonospora curvata (strain ATCC 19995 / DSM 43183 / JCM 3096 / KCTC 9072 / NBRC 15933 / NCIMB 10081 / Henssen B9) TaxID=471852 RepID=D1AC41_THECD|nr:MULTISPECIES: GH1 family beta-glucosidase [Thermomonospora]ACY97307.1 beta-galactosidase [Thermomonospora curvata DSM 43183]PKK14675.1 MAG: beta-glucosidase [Thermomonospora sp. CIF 1]
MTAFSADQQTHQQAADHTAEPFPQDFRWGVATSAYQIEGATAEDGRGRSIWDTFCDTPGAVLGGDTAAEAVDHYHRYREDVALMAELGVNAYRFSLSWPRIQPTGTGPAEQRGLDFYRRLVDALLEAGIEPWVTLYHWDLPQALEDRGGWPERDTALRFAEFAALAHQALGDRVKNWLTINEPWCAAYLGYASGEHAPGRREPAAALEAAHHLLLGHGLALEAMRGQRGDTRIGPAVNLYAVSPAGDAPEDIDAARRIDGLQNRFFLDALLLGRYPEDLLADLAPFDFERCVHDGDLKTIAGRNDLLGINYYTRHTVSGRPGEASQAASSPFSSVSPWVGSEHVRFLGRGRPVTGMGWEIDPEGLREVLDQVHRGYPPVPIYITENGAGYEDAPGPDGTVQDTERIAYLEAHLRVCRQAIADGIPLKGYFTWSLMDNFEWAWGYSRRFGLVYVDYATQRRLPKASAAWYSRVIRRGGLPDRH